MDFHATVMGKRFYENTLPELNNQLKKLNKNLEALLDREEAVFDVRALPELLHEGWKFVAYIDYDNSVIVSREKERKHR